MDINIVKLKKYASECSVLYVEDDELIRTQTASFLNRFFPDVVLAEDGSIGLSKYKQRKFDVVITDINMPKMNGIEMIEAIKEINYEQIILVTSAHNNSEYLMKLINLHVMQFILKPFDNKHFLYILYKIVEGLSLEKESTKHQNKITLLSKNAQIIVDEINVGIVTIKENRVDMVNRAFLEIGGFDSLETLNLEMPEIGVLFAQSSHSINATTNSEFIKQLQSLSDDEKKVSIIRDKKTYEYQISSTKLEDKDSYILTFSDITAIYDAMYLESHTKLPMRKFVWEEIEILKQYTNKLSTILLSVKNFDNIEKWHGKAETIAVKTEFSTIVKEVVQKHSPGKFIGYLGENQIIIISDSNDLDPLYNALSDMRLPTIKLNSQHKKADFTLSTTAKTLQLDISKEINELEVDLAAAYDLM